MNISEGRKAHALKRARSRYKAKLTNAEYRMLAKQIRDGKARFVKRQSNSRTLWWVKYQGEELLAVYVSTTGQIVTFLPKNAREARKSP